MNKTLFGTMPDGSPIYECTMCAGNLTASVITYGGILRRYLIDDVDIVCGFDTLQYYLEDDSHQGALVGRYANRIDGGTFTINGKTYHLTCNDCDGQVHLHGGPTGFSHCIWELTDADDTHVTLRMFSPDGHEGYPGNLTVDVTYSLSETGLVISYYATADKDTPICLTNHAYFNLGGCGSGSILDTNVSIFADEYSVINERMIPVSHAPVANTVFDFTTPHRISERMGNKFGGYDHNYILRPTRDIEVNGVELAHACTAENGSLSLSVYTDQPCLQFYIANALEGNNPFKGGAMPTPHTAMCFEAQAEPNSPGRGEGILPAGKVYTQTTMYMVKKI